MKYRGSILVVDDDAPLRELTREILEADGHEVVCASSARIALARLKEKPFDLLLADLVMPDVDGLWLLREARSHHPDIEVIIMTGYGGIDSAVAAIKEGAYDYITKPFHIEKFSIDIQKALERKRLSEDIGILRRRIEGKDHLGSLIGGTERMQILYRQIEQVAPTQSTILLLGESGTGKEVTARTIHELSSRAKGPFIPVSCGTLPSALLESELFGHTRGAFTGATSSKAGLFDAASGGTIFLDEIGTTTPQTQVGLLRVLQEREIRKVGSTESRKIDVRVVAATNVDLERAMDEGSFRPDLYYRLSSVILRLAPLRDRIEDVPLLAAHFLARHSGRLGKPVRTLSPRSVEILSGYSWPGNVRELEHVIENAVIFSPREIIRPRDLPEAVRDLASAHEGDTLLSLAEIEKRHIINVLKRTGGNKLKAARILGIPRASLYRRITRHGLATEEDTAALADLPAAGRHAGQFVTDN